MTTVPGSLSDADRAVWEETARALDAIGAPQTEARFYGMFQECTAADDGPLDLPGLGGDGARSSTLDDAPLYFSGATSLPAAGPFGGHAAASSSLSAPGAGMFALLAQQGGGGLVVGATAGAQRDSPMDAAQPTEVVAQVAAVAAREELFVDDDGLDTIVLADDGPSPATGGRGGCGGSLEERVLNGDLSGGSVLFDNFTEGMDGGGDAGEEVAGNGDDDDETFTSAPPAAASAPGAGRAGGPMGRRPRGALLTGTKAPVVTLSSSSSASTPPPAAGSDGEAIPEGPAAVATTTEAGEAFEIDPDFDYDIPASRLTSRLGGLGMPGPASASAAPGREGPVDSSGGDDPELEAAHAAAVTAALRGVRPDLAEQLLGRQV